MSSGSYPFLPESLLGRDEHYKLGEGKVADRSPGMKAGSLYTNQKNQGTCNHYELNIVP